MKVLIKSNPAARPYKLLKKSGQILAIALGYIVLHTLILKKLV